VKKRLSISVKGIVQGVGFRPFVYRIAARHHIAGWVINNARGVRIEAEGTAESLRAFLRSIKSQCPPLAHISDLSSKEIPIRGELRFQIKSSRGGGPRDALVSPDVCICDDCLRELFDPRDRRYRYPFINCTNCGPRYTIIKDIPYDRINTTMRPFKMCRLCRSEYGDPASRRFHAQPNACAECGPSVELTGADGTKIKCDDAIAKAQELLKKGKILAVKGLGGFHLAACAENDKAVARLRKRKNREQKPLALMSRDVDAVSLYAQISPDERRLLESPERPIVILRKKHPNCIAPSVSPTNQFFGVMLPYTPLHYLLLDSPLTALVMTSGNISEEPIAMSNTEAFERLGKLADYFLTHDRDIYIRSDDSVVRAPAGHPVILRRARGYAPKPIFLKQPLAPTLAVGPMLKNTVALTKGNRVFLSQHIGDMENLETFRSFEKTVRHLEKILEIHPDLVAYDMHPDYLSTRYALGMKKVKKVPVQHHHAHIASVLAENGLDEKVIGVAFDGTGYGEDGNIWGGEFLIADLKGYERAAHLKELPMPGGEQAIREPWRMAVSYLYGACGDDVRNMKIPFLQKIRKRDLSLLIEMIRHKINSPLTSSAGRLFEAMSALTGVCSRNSYEGQAAMEFEGIAADDVTESYPFDIQKKANKLIIDWTNIVKGVAGDCQQGLAREIISARFHNSIARLISVVCRRLRKAGGPGAAALSGGVFQNLNLLTKTRENLKKCGFAVYEHRLVPPNDGGVALGQAVIANARS